MSSLRPRPIRVAPSGTMRSGRIGCSVERANGEDLLPLASYRRPAPAIGV